MNSFVGSSRRGCIYTDMENGEEVEFKYMGQTGYAIVCEPGDSGGGMQSSWGLKPERLEFKRGCGRSFEVNKS